MSKTKDNKEKETVETPETEAQPEQEKEQAAACEEADETKPDETAKLQEELQKQKELLLRTAAEYDNFRKRTEREKNAIYSDAVADAIEAVLPVADNIERAIEASKDAGEEYKKGLTMIEGQFTASLEKLGVSAFGAPGEEFNPDKHNAVAHIDDETLGENVIAEVFQRGYQIGDKIIRHAMVKVAN